MFRVPCPAFRIPYYASVVFGPFRPRSVPGTETRIFRWVNPTHDNSSVSVNNLLLGNHFLRAKTAADPLRLAAAAAVAVATGLSPRTWTCGRRGWSALPKTISGLRPKGPGPGEGWGLRGQRPGRGPAATTCRSRPRPRARCWAGQAHTVREGARGLLLCLCFGWVGIDFLFLVYFSRGGFFDRRAFLWVVWCCLD